MLLDEEKESKYQVAKRLGLGNPKDGADIYKKRDLTQLNDFLNLLKVSEKSRYYAGWGWEGLPKIPFSVICETVSLTHEEQDKILQTALKAENKYRISKEDITRFKKWKRANPNSSVEEGVKKILSLKPVTVVTHVIVCEVRNKLRDFIKTNSDYKEKILEIFHRKIHGKFYEVEATDILLTISMDEDAFKTFHEKQFKKNIPFTEFVNGLLEEEIVQ